MALLVRHVLTIHEQPTRSRSSRPLAFLQARERANDPGVGVDRLVQRRKPRIAHRRDLELHAPECFLK
jgi:hypothetical protein